MRRRAGDRAQTQPLHCELQHRSIYQAPEDVPEDGPARVLLGSYGSASNAIASPRVALGRVRHGDHNDSGLLRSSAIGAGTNFNAKLAANRGRCLLRARRRANR
jgi:hypothetical protein